jgi:hypothetical protein
MTTPMVWRPRSLRSATLAAVTACALVVACGESDQRNAPAATGGTGATGATGGTGGSTGGTGGDSSGTASTCSYNGVRYENGEVFGACGECICAEGGVFCTDVACPHAAAGKGGTQAGGRGGNGGSTAGGARQTGGTGMVGIPIGGAGAGGTAGIDTSPGGAGGEAGGFECPVVPLTKFCVIGNPASDGLVSLPNKAKLILDLYPTDCSCSKIVSAVCPTFSNGVAFQVNRDICLEPDGNDCHDPCTASQIVHCDTGITLGASSSDIRVELPGTELFVSLKVPSVVPAEDLCATVP